MSVKLIDTADVRKQLDEHRQMHRADGDPQKCCNMDEVIADLLSVAELVQRGCTNGNHSWVIEDGGYSDYNRATGSTYYARGYCSWCPATFERTTVERIKLVP